MSINRRTEEQLLSPGDSPLKYKNSGLPPSYAQELAEAIEKQMTEDKLFRDSTLRLPTLAVKLNTRLHYVSQVINQIYHVTFFEYVNQKRIEAAKELLRRASPEELRIIEVAYAIGYNNKNTFNSAFKRLTGLTPSQFRDSYGPFRHDSKQTSGRPAVQQSETTARITI